MAANRKKGKKSQSSNQGKSESKKPAIETATSVSDNAIGGATTDSVSVDWEKGAPSLSAQDTSISSEGAQEEQTPEAEPQVDSEQSADNAGSSNSSADAELNDSSQSASVTAHSEVPTSPAETETPAEALDTSPQADFSPDTAEVVMQEPAAIAETTPSIEAPNTVSQDASNVKLTAPETPEAQTPAVNDPPKIDVNFGKDEIRTLLVPVSPFNRLIACIIVIFSSSILGYIILKTPAGLNAQGMHTIDLPEPGAPEGAQATVRRPRDGILGHPHRGTEEPGHEVELRPRGSTRDDDAARIQPGQRGEVGTQAAHVVLG